MPEMLTEKRYKEFIARLKELDMVYDFGCKREMADIAAKLAASVNSERLCNHPVCLSEKELTDMYLAVFNF
jgi:hypothetical protein